MLWLEEEEGEEEGHAAAEAEAEAADPARRRRRRRSGKTSRTEGGLHLSAGQGTGEEEEEVEGDAQLLPEFSGFADPVMGIASDMPLAAGSASAATAQGAAGRGDLFPTVTEEAPQRGETVTAPMAEERSSGAKMKPKKKRKERVPTMHRTLAVLIQSMQGKRVLVELKNDVEVEGVLDETDANINMTLLDVQQRMPMGDTRCLDVAFVSGAMVRYVHIPDDVNVYGTLRAHVRTTGNIRQRAGGHRSARR